MGSKTWKKSAAPKTGEAKLMHEIAERHKDLVDVAGLPDVERVHTEFCITQVMFDKDRHSIPNWAQKKYGVPRCDIVLVHKDGSVSIIEVKMYKESDSIHHISRGIGQLLVYDMMFKNHFPDRTSRKILIVDKLPEFFWNLMYLQDLNMSMIEWNDDHIKVGVLAKYASDAFKENPYRINDA
jgi:hypothetical protein